MSKAIFELSEEYIKQAGDTASDVYQKRGIMIISLQYFLLGALMSILPFLEQDPKFMCPIEGQPGKMEECFDKKAVDRACDDHTL
jgi:hypothetical protein